MQKYKVSFKGQNIFVGIDVHLKTWHVVSITESGYKISFSQRSDAKVLFDTLNKKFPDAHFKSAYEAGFCGFSVHYKLTELGFENIVINPADVPTSNKEKVTKTDAVDAEKIARALKQGQLTPIHIKSKEYMDDTNLIRLRSRFVKDLGRMKSRTKHLLYNQGVEYPERFQKNGTHWSRNFIAWLRNEVEFLSEEKRTLMLLVDEVENLRKAVLRITKEIRRLAVSPKYKENFELLTSVPGIGKITGMSLLTEIDNDLGRFSNERQFASFLGLIPTCHNSGEKTSNGMKTFRGNHQIGPLIVEASWVAIRNDRELSNCYINYCQRMKPQTAIIKIARKLACKLFAVLKTRKKYVHQ
ncbi:MAG: IS110 family transposase [Bacteroidales bacterium]|nr:IS110 family transposase [Bacteroidales bacterium]